MRTRRGRVVPVALALAALTPVAARPEPASLAGTAVVSFADGTSVPLQGWTLSYEYVVFRQGTSPDLSPPARREGRELWVGRRSIALDGVSVEVQHRRSPVLVVTGKDRQETLRFEAPARERLLDPGAGKGLLVVPRSLDLMGQTLTGTRREVCVVSFSALVECGSSPADQVVKIEFGP